MSARRDELGAHVSIAGGLALAPARGRALGCGAIQVLETPKAPEPTADLRNLATLRRLRRPVSGPTSRRPSGRGH